MAFVNSIAIADITNNEITECYNTAMASTAGDSTSDGIQMNFIAFIEVLKLLQTKKIINMF